MNCYHDVIKKGIWATPAYILEHIADGGPLYQTQEEAAEAFQAQLRKRLASVPPKHKEALLALDREGDEGGALVSRLAEAALSANDILDAVFMPDIGSDDIVWVRKLERLYETFKPYSEGLSALSQLVWLHFEERLPYLDPLDAQGFVIYPGQLFFDHTDPLIEVFVEHRAGTSIGVDPRHG